MGNQHCGEVLEDLSKLNAEIFKKKEHKDLSKHEESRPESSIASQVKKEEIILAKETKVEEEEDMFGDKYFKSVAWQVDLCGVHGDGGWWLGEAPGFPYQPWKPCQYDVLKA